jgi:tRNA threonylcarbamoyladenosine biosynthesis protein TsaE
MAWPGRIITDSAKESQQLGTGLARFLKPGDVVALSGDLGSGKTTFTKGIARGLGVKDPEYVNSPSFVLIREYRGKTNLYHFDLYRLDNICDIEYIGMQDYLNGDGVIVIEWADKLKGLLPGDHLHVEISILGESKREFIFKGHGKRYNTIVDRHLKP